MNNTNIQKNCRLPGITYQEYFDMAVAEWSKYNNGICSDMGKALFITYAVETVWNETERCSTYARAIKKLKPVQTALPEVERTADYFFNLALDILLCVDILFCYDSTDEVPGKYCNRLIALIPKEYKRECESIFMGKLRYAVTNSAKAI